MEPSNDYGSPFFSGWRPSIGWVALIAFILQFNVIPIIGIVLALWHGTALPSISITDALALVTTTFALGGMRTIEKIKGVHTKWLSRSTPSDSPSPQSAPQTQTVTQTTVVEVSPSPSTTSTVTPATDPSAAITASTFSSLASVITPILSKIMGRK